MSFQYFVQEGYLFYALGLVYVLWAFFYIIKKKDNKVDEETKKVLKIMDSLLGKLPKQEIKGFSKSKDYKMYRRVLHKYGLR